MVGRDIGPDGVLRIWWLGNDPEALLWVVDDGHDFIGDRGHGPGFAQEVQGVIGVEAALKVKGQVQV